VTISNLHPATSARLLLVVLSLIWGLTWVAMRVALDEVTPWTMRTIGYIFGLTFLLLWALAQHRSLGLQRGRDWAHVFMASLFNVVGFGIFSAFAILDAATSRVIIVVYSMPVWASLMAWIVLRERIGLNAAAGLILCLTGLSILVGPVIGVDSLNGLMLAMGCSLCWAGGTVYMKWAAIRGDIVAITAWQVALGIIAMFSMRLAFDGPPTFEPLAMRTWLAIAFAGFLGSGLAYAIWFSIIDKVPTSTAALGVLTNPVVGVVGAIIILGDRPPLPDLIGFAFIFAAAACVLLKPAPPTPAVTESSAGPRPPQA